MPWVARGFLYGGREPCRVRAGESGQVTVGFDAERADAHWVTCDGRLGGLAEATGEDVQETTVTTEGAVDGGE